MAVIHMINPKIGSTIDKYGEIFLSHTGTYRVDVIFDIYLQPSLKDGVRKTLVVDLSMTVRGTTKIKN